MFFHLAFKDFPKECPLAIFAGLSSLQAKLSKIEIHRNDLVYIHSLKSKSNSLLFEDRFIVYLDSLAWDFDVFSVKEGTPVCRNQPIFQIEGSLGQLLLLERLIRQHVQFQTAVATKIRRFVAIAAPSLVLELGGRDFFADEVGEAFSRASYIGGSFATSNLKAAEAFQIPICEEMSANWDIYALGGRGSTLRQGSFYTPMFIRWGAKGEMNKKFFEIIERQDREKTLKISVDIDGKSKELTSLKESLWARGFKDVCILAKGITSEATLQKLKYQGVKVDLWAVGKSCVDDAWVDAFYPVYQWVAKQEEIGWLSVNAKQPFVRKQIFRHMNQGLYTYDTVEDEAALSCDISKLQIGQVIPLVEPVMKKGRLLFSPPPLQQVRKRVFCQMRRFSYRQSALQNPAMYKSFEKAGNSAEPAEEVIFANTQNDLLTTSS